MKKVVYMFVCATTALLAACSLQTKNEKDDIHVLMNDSTGVNAPQSMQASKAQTTITYKGKEYQWSVVRCPDEKLPVVKNEQGERFVDNSITLKIISGGKSLVDKVFTKENFASLVDAGFMKRGILESLVYDKTTSRGIEFVASICYPQTDLYVPIRITVGSKGEVSMAKEELLEDLFETDSIG